jgi:NAD(P)H-flavin reductase
MLRQYSLCGDYHDSSRWQIAVLREENGRGGSQFIHEHLREGDTLKVSVPAITSRSNHVKNVCLLPEVSVLRQFCR